MTPCIRSRLTTAAGFVAFGAVGRADCGRWSDRRSALAQTHFFLTIVNYETDLMAATTTATPTWCAPE